MIKLYVFDVDGTLITSYHEMTKKTVDTLKLLQDKGREVMIASGRCYDMMIRYIKENDLHFDLILNNGNEYRSEDQKTHLYYPMDHDVLKEVVDILRDYDFEVSIHTDHGKYCFDDLEYYYQKHHDMLASSFKDKLYLMERASFFAKEDYLRNCCQIDSIQELIDEDVKVLKIDAKNKSIASGSAGIERLKQLDHILLSSSYGDYVEVCGDTMDKGTLIEKVALMKGYHKDEIAVFGDGTNDIGMLRLFKNSYAMKNANDDVKKYACYVTEYDNNEDGVAKQIEEILKKEGV